MVKDLASHLLDGNLRTLSMLRDDYAGEAPSDVSYAGIVANLNRLNADKIRAARRLRPVVFIEMLVQSGAEYTVCIAALEREDNQEKNRHAERSRSISTASLPQTTL